MANQGGRYEIRDGKRVLVSGSQTLTTQPHEHKSKPIPATVRKEKGLKKQEIDG